MDVIVIGGDKLARGLTLEGSAEVPQGLWLRVPLQNEV